MAEGEITTFTALTEKFNLPPGNYKKPKLLYCSNGGHFLRILPDGKVDGTRDRSDQHSKQTRWGFLVLLLAPTILSARKGGAGEDGLCTKLYFLLVPACLPGHAPNTPIARAGTVCVLFPICRSIESETGHECNHRQAGRLHGTQALIAWLAAVRKGLGAASHPTCTQPSHRAMVSLHLLWGGGCSTVVIEVLL